MHICLHEASCLFEDIATICKYIEKCGKVHRRKQLWLDIRNHIRHDVREEFDNENKKKKELRAIRLGIEPSLQTSIGFDKDAIKIGSTTVRIKEVEKFLSYSEKLFNKVLEIASNKKPTEHSYVLGFKFIMHNGL